MRDRDFQDWQRERDAVEQEMDHLIAAGVPASLEERQVRRTRYAALIERREAAARNLLQSDRRRDKSPRGASRGASSGTSSGPSRGPSRPGDYFISASHEGPAAEGQQAAFVALPDGRRKAEAPPGLSTHSAVAGAAGVSADAAELPADVAALAPDTAALPPETAALLPRSVIAPADAPVAAPSPHPVANDTDAAPLATDNEGPSDLSSADLHSDAALLAPDTAAVPAAGASADAAELLADAAALAPDASFLAEPAAPHPHPVTVPAAAPDASPSPDALPLAADTEALSSSEAAASLPHPVVRAAAPVATHSPDAGANATDAAPAAADAKAPSAPSSTDDASSLLQSLLRRLQSSIAGPAPNGG
jgi:hypothetical protein